MKRNYISFFKNKSNLKPINPEGELISVHFHLLHYYFFLLIYNFSRMCRTENGSFKIADFFNFYLSSDR